MKSALRIYLSVSYVMKSITSISHLRWLPPFGALRHHLPPAVRWDNKAPRSSPFISSSQHNGAFITELYSAPACGGKVVAPATKGGMHFLERSEAGLFSSGESPVVWFSPPKAAFILAPLRAPTSPAQRYFITPEGESPQPVREASAGPGQNPWRPGPSGPAAPSTLAAKDHGRPTKWKALLWAG